MGFKNLMNEENSSRINDKGTGTYIHEGKEIKGGEGLYMRDSQ